MLQNDLFEDARLAIRVYLRERGVSKDTFSRHDWCLNQIISFFFSEKVYEYDGRITEAFRVFLDKKHLNNEICYVSKRRAIRVSYMLDDYYNSRIFKDKYFGENRCKYKISNNNLAILNDFIELLNVSKNSISGYKSSIRKFLFYFEMSNLSDLSTIDEDFILDFFVTIAHEHRGSMNNIQCAVRSFLLYLNEKKINDINADDILSHKTVKSHKKVNLPLSDDVLNKLISSIDRKTNMGKRDFAIITLAEHTGLRAIDIANLKIDNIDFSDKILRFFQHKTGYENELPLNKDTIEAILIYLKVRPLMNPDDRYIFLTMVPPIRKLNDISSVRNIMNKYLRLSKVEINSHLGNSFHGLRRRLGVKLLESNTDIEMIAQILGHTNLHSLKPYLALDIEKMRYCALGLEMIPVFSEVYQ